MYATLFIASPVLLIRSNGYAGRPGSNPTTCVGLLSRYWSTLLRFATLLHGWFLLLHPRVRIESLAFDEAAVHPI